MFRKQIKSWLEAGILGDIENTNSEYNEAGIPQGGVISPLLSNIALHGMETLLLSKFSRGKVKLIRYADDFVIMGKDLKDIIKSKKIVEEFLTKVGLELSEGKTRIGHSMNYVEGKSRIRFFRFSFQKLSNIKTPWS